MVLYILIYMFLESKEKTRNPRPKGSWHSLSSTWS